MIQFIDPIFKAWGPGGRLVNGREGENTAKQGFNSLLITTFQVSQAANWAESLSWIAKQTNLTFLRYFYLIPLLPFVVGTLKPVTDYLKDEDRVTHSSDPLLLRNLSMRAHLFHYRNPVLVSRLSLLANKIFELQPHLGTIFQLASVVNGFVLLYLGQIVYATTLLTLLTFGCLARHHCIPLPILSAYSSISPWITNLSLLICGSWFLKLQAVCELIASISLLLFQKKRVPYAQASQVSHMSNVAAFDEIYKEKVQLEVDRSHIWIEALPYCDPIEISSFTSFCANYQWEQERLRDAIDKDEARKEQTNGQDLVRYAQDSLKKLIKSIEEESIQTTDVMNYSLLKRFLACVAVFLPKASKDMQQEILLKLAFDGGNFCGAGIYKQLGDAVATLVSQQADLPLYQKILFILELERLRVVEAFHMAIGIINPGIHLMSGGQEDIHSMNQTIVMLANDFGLPDLGASQDPTTVTSMMDTTWQKCITGIYSEDLWQGLQNSRRGIFIQPIEGYTVDRIFNTIFAYVGTFLISNDEVFEWARNWVKKDPSNKEAFEERIMSGEFMNGLKLKDLFIKAMLVDMGILNIKRT